MVSTYTPNKNLELPGNGDYVDTWNIPANGDFSIIDAALGGLLNLNATSGSATLTDTEYQNLIINITGAMSGNVVYTIPSGVGGQWVVYNNTSGLYTVTFASGGGGNTEVVPQGQVAAIASTGTDIWLVTTAASSVPTGGGTNKIFYNNDQTVTDDYSIPPSQNSGTFGPVSIDSGVTVTVPSGSNWTVI